MYAQNQTAAPTPTPTAAPASVRWTVDRDHSEVAFRARHMMVSWTRGTFRRFEGTVLLDDAHPEQGRVEVTIDAASVDTNVPQRDAHLRSPDFFDVEQHPAITFRSTAIARAGQDALRVEGALTIRGVTRQVTLEVEGVGRPWSDPWGGVRRGATAHARVSRKEFGLTWNGVVEGTGVLIGDEVQIALEIELIRAAPGAQG